MKFGFLFDFLKKYDFLNKKRIIKGRDGFNISLKIKLYNLNSLF